MAFAIAYLMLPVAVMALFSFNDPPGKSNVAWHQFSLDGVAATRSACPGSSDVVRTSVVGRVHLDDRRDRARDADRARPRPLQLPRLAASRTP